MNVPATDKIEKSKNTNYLSLERFTFGGKTIKLSLVTTLALLF